MPKLAQALPSSPELQVAERLQVLHHCIIVQNQDQGLLTVEGVWFCSGYKAQAGLEIVILLPLPLGC